MATRRRVIIDTDAKNEADDQYAIVHALLSPSLDVRGIIPAHFGTWRSDQSMIDSASEVDLLLELMDLTGQVAGGQRRRRRPSPTSDTPADSPGARLIIAESLLASADDRLYVAFLGPLTDMASAILLDPGDRRPDRHRDLDRRGGPRRSRPAAEDRSSTSPTTSRPPTWCSTRASRCGRCRATSTRWCRSPTPSWRRRSAAPASSADYLIRPAGGVERHLPPRSDRVALPG